MLTLRGIYENGILKLDNSINVNKPVEVIVTFIDENISINSQLNDKNKEAKDYLQYITQLKTKYKDLPVTWSESEPNPDNLFGIWKDKNISLEQIREKAWKRK